MKTLSQGGMKLSRLQAIFVSLTWGILHQWVVRGRADVLVPRFCTSVRAAPC